METRVEDSGVIENRAAVCDTVITTDAEADPALAVMVDDPLVLAVTRPAALTSATEVSLLPQLTGVVMGLPFWSKTDADNWIVCPMAVSVLPAGDMVTRVGTDGGESSCGDSDFVGPSLLQDPSDSTNMATAAERRT